MVGQVIRCKTLVITWPTISQSTMAGLLNFLSKMFQIGFLDFFDKRLLIFTVVIHFMGFIVWFETWDAQGFAIKKQVMWYIWPKYIFLFSGNHIRKIAIYLIKDYFLKFGCSQSFYDWFSLCPWICSKGSDAFDLYYRKLDLSLKLPETYWVPGVTEGPKRGGGAVLM